MRSPRPGPEGGKSSGSDEAIHGTRSSVCMHEDKGRRPRSRIGVPQDCTSVLRSLRPEV
uniref:Uncharacterized protein n=1 Tax=Setaria italica TaxID=4555 RepID=K3ZYX5_SETIT